MGDQDDDALAEVIDPRSSFAAPGDMASENGVPKMLAEQEEEEGLMLDWGDKSETKSRDVHGGKGASTGRPVPQQVSQEIEAEYESTLTELKVRMLPCWD